MKSLLYRRKWSRQCGWWALGHCFWRKWFLEILRRGIQELKALLMECIKPFLIVTKLFSREQLHVINLREGRQRRKGLRVVSLLNRSQVLGMYSWQSRRRRQRRKLVVICCTPWVNSRSDCLVCRLVHTSNRRTYVRNILSFSPQSGSFRRS